MGERVLFVCTANIAAHDGGRAIVAGNEKSIVMVEGGAQQLPEDEVLAALKHAHAEIQPIIAAISELQAKVGKEKLVMPEPEDKSVLEKRIEEKRLAAAEVIDALEIALQRHRFGAVLAGLAGLGTVFDVFRPSAGIRFLAIARTGSRYGERLATHDATLKVLAGLRVRLLDGLSRADFTLQSRLRGGQALNRLTADVDALDGLAIRLVFPLLALLIAALAVLTGLWLLVAPSVALWVAGATFSGAVAVLAWAGKAAFGPSSEAEARRQALRSATVDHLRGRDWLAVAGRLTAARETVLSQDRRARAAALAQARIEHRATAALQAAGAMTLAGTLYSTKGPSAGVCARRMPQQLVGKCAKWLDLGG